MKNRSLLATFCASIILTACGGDGGDLEQSLNLGGPQVRFVNAAPGTPLLRVYRKGNVENGAGTQGYEGTSRYFDSVAVTSDWTVKDAGSGAQWGSTSMRVENGTRYTLVALPAGANAVNLLQISDPYSNALTDKARLRFVNATPGAVNYDVYLTLPGADISAISPTIAAVPAASVKPDSGSNSYSLPTGTYEVRLTPVGGKSVFFQGTLKLDTHDDLLLLSLPAADGSHFKLLEVPSATDENNLEILDQLAA